MIAVVSLAADGPISQISKFLAAYWDRRRLSVAVDRSDTPVITLHTSVGAMRFL
jgi:hypothetical protein